jgi:polysaccharide pyruvyl transferase WcaK-like protein
VTLALEATAPVSGAALLAGLGLGDRDSVLILGGYGVGNVGDEAILAGLLAQLPAVGRLRVVSRDPTETRTLHGVAAVSPLGVLPALAASDVLIVGGGGIFSSDTGPFGRFIPLVCRVARLRGLRLVFHGLGVYSSTPPSLLRSIVRLGPAIESFSVRDSASLETLGRAGLAVQRVADLSESLSPAEARSTREFLISSGIDPDRPSVALCLTRLNEPLGRFLEATVPELVAALPNIQFCFLPISHHPTRNRHNDLMFGRVLAERCPEINLIEGGHHPALVLGLFRHFAAAVCVRFHSYLFASRMNVPIVALPYAEKCESWLAEQGLGGCAWTPAALIDAVTAAVGASAGREAA